jgi:hypothetical protein
VEKALAGDIELARPYALVLEELAETINLNETLGEPSASVAERLFAAIDVEEARTPRRRPVTSCAMIRPPPGSVMGMAMKTRIVSMLLKRPSPVSVLRSSTVGRTPEFTHLAWHEIPWAAVVVARARWRPFPRCRQKTWSMGCCALECGDAVSAQANFSCTFFHTFTGEIGPSGVSTLLPVSVIVSP